MIRLSWPSKTFVLGEYAVLRGYPGTVICSQPRFEAELHFEIKKNEGQSNLLIFEGFSVAGPAQKYQSALVEISKLFLERNLCPQIRVTLKDPHGGRGGFGSSAAELLALWTMEQFLNFLIKGMNSADGAAFEVGFQDYLKSLLSQVNTRVAILDTIRHRVSPFSIGSGSDILAMITGGLCRVMPKQNEARRLKVSNSESLVCLIFRTGFKVATHEHVQDLSDDFLDLVSGGLPHHDIVDASENQMTESAHQWGKHLVREGLCLKETQEKVKVLAELPGVKTAKGCGAMGADSVLVFCSQESSEQVKAIAKSLDLELVAQPEFNEPGFQWELSQ